MSEPDLDPDEVMRPGQVAELFGVDAKTLARWDADGTFKAMSHTSGGERRYRRGDVMAAYPHLGAYSIRRVARRFGVDTKTVTAWVKAGLLEPDIRNAAGHGRWLRARIEAMASPPVLPSPRRRRTAPDPQPSGE